MSVSVLHMQEVAPVTGTPSPDLMERLLTRLEVAAVMRVSPRTVTSWARVGRLRSTRTPGGQYRFRESDVKEQIAAENQSGPAR
jgi:excisionase family DNA binding protein